MFCVGNVGKFYIRKEQEAVRNMKGELIQPKKRRLEAKFQIGGTVPDFARKRALEALSFPGLPENADPLSQLTWFDSLSAAQENSWTAEELKFVEDWLRANDGNGFVIVEQPVVAAPFPNWLKQTKAHGQRKIEHVVADAVKFVDEMGLDPALVIEFEKQQGRAESQAIIDALSEVPADEPVEQVVAA